MIETKMGILDYEDGGAGLMQVRSEELQFIALLHFVFILTLQSFGTNRDTPKRPSTS